MNTLDAIVPKILARGMLSFREQAIMPRLVNNDFSAEAARKGDSIEIPVPGTVEVKDVEPSVTPPAPDSTTLESHSLTLDNWKKVSFFLNDKDLAKVDVDQHFVPFQLQEAIGALADEVNKTFIDQVQIAGHVIGQHDKTLFSQDSADAGKSFYKTNPAITARRLLNSSKAPKEGRYAMLSYEQEASALALGEFADAEKTGDSGVRIDGEIGRKYGINWYSSSYSYHHEATKLTNNLRVVHRSESDDLTLSITQLDRSLKVGDVLTKSDGTPLLVVGRITTPFSRNAMEIASTGAVQSLPAGGQNVKVALTHDNSMIFHRDAFAFATRPLASMAEGFGNRILSVTDPLSGLSLRLEVSRQYKQTVWELDILWGVKMVKPELAVRMVSS